MTGAMSLSATWSRTGARRPSSRWAISSSFLVAKFEYRDTVLEEMDLPAVISRSPDLALIDELAHTNPPGLEHEKRYEDVQDVLDAGIDVYSTVNVQHLESLNDSVCELTGVRVRETLPDAVLNDADEVVLMDLTPEALLDRLREGRIYPAERIDSALNNFFRIENLAALREVALRQVAQEVESKRLVKEPLGQREDRLADSAATQAVGERLLALIKPTPRAQRLVRRAFRSAQRLGADLDLLWVKKPGYKPTPEEQNQLDGIGRVAAVLGAHVLVEEGDDLAQTVKEIAEEKGSTYVLIGTPKPRTGLDRLRPSLVSRLIESLPGVDLRVVADRALRGEEEP